MRRYTKLILSIFVFIIRIPYRWFMMLMPGGVPASYVTLTYHNVRSDQVESFRRQMLFLFRHVVPITADMKGPFQKGRIHVAVTFDDGFKGVLLNALVILRELEIPATIFITTGYFGQKPGWILSPAHGNANTVLLTEEEVAGMRDSSISIGSHSISHPRLSSLSRTECIMELEGSKAILEEILDQQVHLLSFPHGDMNNDVLDSAFRAGYKKVFLNVPRMFFRPDKDKVVGRIDISPEDWSLEYKLKIMGAYQWLPVAIAVKRHIFSRSWREVFKHASS